MGREELEKSITLLSERLDACAATLQSDVTDRGLDMLDKVDTYLTHSVFGSDLKTDSKQNIVTLGTTGAGKSTVASFLFGTGDVLVHQQGLYARVLVADPPLPGTIIGSGSTSVTLLPVVNHVHLGDKMVAVWDMPGSRDTRGPFAELLVHFIYQWMLKDDKDLRFVIVSPPLHERPQQVMLESMINSSLIHEDNAVVVYTKCSEGFNPDSTSDLELHESKQGIRSFALPAPFSADEDGCNYSLRFLDRKLEVLKALQNLRSYPVKYVEPLPPAAARLLDRFGDSSVAFARDVLSTAFLNVYDWNSYVGTVEEIEDTLASLKHSSTLSFEAVVDILLRLVPLKSDDIRHDPEVAKAGRRVSLVGTAIGTSIHRHMADWLNADCIRAIEEAKERLVELRCAVLNYSYHEKGSDRSNKFVLVVSAFHLHLSKELNRVHKFVEKHRAAITSAEAIPVVIAVGYASLEVDAELKVWANVALVSPFIQVKTNGLFELSAAKPVKWISIGNNVRGSCGARGKPGLPGGNLIVYCGTLYDPNDRLFSTRSCGQRGGDGQNGGDGVNGQDSRYTSVAFTNDIGNAIQYGSLTNHEGYGANIGRNVLQVSSYQDHVSPMAGRIYGSQAIKFWTITKESVPGEKGKRPGHGGFGGAGGRGGWTRLQAGNVVKEAMGSTGPRGNDGKNGKASRDGRGSPSFSATVHQWFFKGGWYNGSKADPQIDNDIKSMESDIRPWMYPNPVQKPGEDTRFNDVSKSRVLHFIQNKYEVLFTQLESKFPQCRFGNLKVGWETAKQ